MTTRIPWKSACWLLLALPLTGASFGPAAPAADAPNGPDLMRRMLQAVNAVQTCTYRLVKQERHAGKMVADEGQVKVQAQPFKVYLRQTSPNNGLEILYATGQNHNKALVNPNAFPWVNVSLDPMGARIREGRHHTVFDIGFRRLAHTIQHQLDVYKADLPRLVKVEPQAVTFDGRRCWLVQIDNPAFRYAPYTVPKGGESLAEIGERFGVSEHMIGEHLAGFDGDYSAKLAAGKVVQVPTTYARKMQITIDQQTQLLVGLRAFDEKGLYEDYEYHDLKPGVTFAPNEFSPDFKGYNF